MSQANAEKNFKKKFQDKTKNKWDKREEFTAVKGKYTLVEKTDSSQNSLTTESQVLLFTLEDCCCSNHLKNQRTKSYNFEIY